MNAFVGNKINNSISGPIHIDYGSDQNKFLVDSKNNLICIAQDATQAELDKLVDGFNGHFAADKFFTELNDSVESLTAIADEHGARTLADLMYLQSAILSGGFIDYYPSESKVVEIVKDLPSADDWMKFIKMEYLMSPQE